MPDSENPRKKYLVQCDFDATVTVEDASFIILDNFARGNWREINAEYEAGKMSVGRFNEAAVSLMQATKQEMLDAIKDRVSLRPGFGEFADFCRKRDIRLVIVSNGFDVYIEHFLQKLGLDSLEYHAASLNFDGGGKITTAYIGPDGQPVDDGFKDAFLNRFQDQGYEVIYIGDGSSDFRPAQKCRFVFARDTLRQKYEAAGFSCRTFNDFHDVMALMKRLV
jgi:2-hydroxy-3-keto-5-methylthiopentenyl-1-phosphate phosphatase